VSIVSTEIEISGPGSPDFSATPLSGCAPHGVQFSEQSTFTPKKRVWDFGDGTTSELRSPFHVYDRPGTYSVRVMILCLQEYSRF
jgi:PKD repeat protein